MKSDLGLQIKTDWLLVKVNITYLQMHTPKVKVLGVCRIQLARRREEEELRRFVIFYFLKQLEMEGVYLKNKIGY